MLKQAKVDRNKMVDAYVEKNIKMADIVKWEENNGATASLIQNAHKEMGLA